MDFPIPTSRTGEIDRKPRPNRLPADSRAWCLLLAVCLGSRPATSISYIEDIDSLRFALSVLRYSVADLQPHFPGYPVFSWPAGLLYRVIGDYSLAFSLLGGLSTFVLIYFLLKLARLRPATPSGMLLVGLVFFNPQVWLLGNRFMPDLMGAAVLLFALERLLGGGGDIRNTQHTRSLMQGFFLVGLLGGLRLSYLPFLVLPCLYLMVIHRRRLRHLTAFTFSLAAGILLWLLPLIAVTGWQELWAAGQAQTLGHFADFGGTVFTEPGWGRRFALAMDALFAHGLGFWWPGRNIITVVVTLGLGLALVVAFTKAFTGAWNKRMLWRDLLQDPRALLMVSCLVYAIWAFFFQNMVHKSRHVLPLIPFFLWAVSIGFGELRVRLGSRQAFTVFAAVALSAYIAVCMVLVVQHRKPTALAQVLAYVRTFESSQSEGKPLVVAHPLVRYYLASQGIRADFIHPFAPKAKNEIEKASQRPLIVVGYYPEITRNRAHEKKIFHHNPYVNRMWPEIPVYCFE